MDHNEIVETVRALSQESDRLRRQIVGKLDGQDHRNTFFIAREELEALNFQITALTVMMEKLELHRTVVFDVLEKAANPWDGYLRPASTL